MRMTYASADSLLAFRVRDQHMPGTGTRRGAGQELPVPLIDLQRPSDCTAVVLPHRNGQDDSTLDSSFQLLTRI